MKITLLLVGVGLCALVVSAQKPAAAAADYDYYDELAEGAPAAADITEAEALPPPEQQPLTEAPTEKPATPSAPKSRKRLINLRAPVRRPSGVRRRPSTVIPDVSEVTTAAPASSAPVRGTSGRGSSSLSRRRPSRVRTTTQANEAASTTPEEQPAPSRSSGRGTRVNRPSRKPVTTSGATSSRRFSRPSSAAAATTEAPVDTTHRFGGRRSHLSKSTPTEALGQETTTSRFGRRRRV